MSTRNHLVLFRSAGRIMERHIYGTKLQRFSALYKSSSLYISLQSLWILFLTPISCVANQYTPAIKKITSFYVNLSYLQNSTHRDVPTPPTQLVSAAWQKARWTSQGERHVWGQSSQCREDKLQAALLVSGEAQQAGRWPPWDLRAPRDAAPGRPRARGLILAREINTHRLLVSFTYREL